MDYDLAAQSEKINHILDIINNCIVKLTSLVNDKNRLPELKSFFFNKLAEKNRLTGGPNQITLMQDFDARKIEILEGGKPHKKQRIDKENMIPASSQFQFIETEDC